MNEIVKQEVAKNGVARQYSPSSTISIADFLKKINPADESFYKCIPKPFIEPASDQRFALRDDNVMEFFGEEVANSIAKGETVGVDPPFQEEMISQNTRYAIKKLSHR